MNNVVANFEQIIDFAKEYGLPLSKKRGILCEYLQCKILDILYREGISSQMIFVGGTALRLTQNSDRFSEDLDFDLGRQVPYSKVKNLIQKTLHHRLEKENFSIDVYHNKTRNRNYYEFRFKDLLQELNISRQREEKLVIKFDFEKFWQGHKKEPLLLNRYGFLVNVLTIPLGQQLAQKLTAYIKRRQTQPRDIYDIIWLVSHGATIDLEFIRNNSLPKDLKKKALNKFQREKQSLLSFKKRLKPFLINEGYVDKLDLFPRMVASL